MTDEIDTGSMSPAMLEALMSSPVLARLATASIEKCQPHVVPVWFAWDGESLWISSY